MKKRKIILTALLLISTYLFSGCASYFSPLSTSPARLGPVTEMNKELSALPAPNEKIVAAVYKFRDQTGQYKQTENGTSWSTAVTQGATSILLRALEESNWFIPIEREGLSNLLNERKIIRSSRMEYGQSENNQPVLPPLLFAGVILEGGIISYESNIITGGAGLKYFGVGANGQYREDRVSIYLRAISTQSGRILKTVYTTKTILSQMVDVNFFRFVNFKRLLEAETGFTYNEPTEMCVTEAIEKAVHSLIIEGVLDNLWTLKDSSDMSSNVIKEYVKERNENKGLDYFGREITKNSEYGFGIATGTQLYSGDFPNAVYKPATELSLKLHLSQEASLDFCWGYSQLKAQRYFESNIYSMEIKGKYQLASNSRISPFFIGGVGLLHSSATNFKKNENIPNNSLLGSVIAGAGIELRILKPLGLNVSIDYHYIIADNIDGMSIGKLNDAFWGAKVGFTYYIDL